MFSSECGVGVLFMVLYNEISRTIVIHGGTDSVQR